ncbi:MAG: spore germination protein [Clostridiales bacterium]|nr:spore germination protein [Clostridiales bacterium]
MEMMMEKTDDVFDASHTIFSQNHKISPRQIRRALTLELFGVSSLLLPAYLAGGSGILGVAALGIGAAGAGALVCVWDRLSEHCDFEDAKNQIARRVILAVSGIGLLGLAVYVLYVLTTLLRDQLLTAQYELAILITLTAAGIFGLRKGLESRIRVYEVLFWFLIVPLVIMLILACFSVHPRYWSVTSFSAQGFWKSCGISFLFFSVASLILFFKPHCSEPGAAAKSAKYSIFLALMLNVAVYLILIGIFQDTLLSQLQFPAVFLMSVVKLPGGFFERQDAFMVGIWFFCLFALFHSLLFYGSKSLQNALQRNEPSQSGGSRMSSLNEQKNIQGEKEASGQAASSISGGICGAAVFLGTLWLLRHEVLAGQCLNLLICLIGPMLLILPLVYFGVSRMSRKCSGRKK